MGCQQCTLIQEQREVRDREQRISIKEKQYEDLMQQERMLKEEKKSLLSELEAKQLTLDQLSARLTKLQNDNAQIKADTNQQQEEKERLDQQIRQYQEDINTLKKNNQLSDRDKQQRINSLREEIKKYLEIGLR